MHHRRSIIFRREATETTGLEERLVELLVSGSAGARGKYNGSKHIFWSQDRGGYKIQIAGVKDPGDERKWQGRPHDLKAFDEVSSFLLSQYLFLNIWKRSSVAGQRCRTIAAGNPPTTEDGMWVISYWAPWIDPSYLGKRAKVGELRYFFTDSQGKMFECEAGEKVKYKGKEYEPKSRTFIPSSISDNIYFEGTGYESQLAQLPPELRDKFLLGDFSSGIQADPHQLIPRAWVELAQARWRARPLPLDVPRNSLGVDVSRNGNDETYVTPMRGTYVETQITYPKSVTKNGLVLAQKLSEEMTHTATFCKLDIAGIGTSPGDHLSALKPNRVLFMNGAESALGRRDRSGLLGFMNSRAAWYWALRESLDPTTGDDLALPPDPELLKELCSIRWFLTKSGIKMEDKDEIKKRIGRSPDRADSLVNAVNEPIIKGAGLLGFYSEQAQAETARRVEVDQRNQSTRIIIGG